jgi:hypothetical protein
MTRLAAGSKAPARLDEYPGTACDCEETAGADGQPWRSSSGSPALLSRAQMRQRRPRPAGSGRVGPSDYTDAWNASDF